MNAKNQSPLPPSQPRASQLGFTLVEIMVVIVILGLLATLVTQNVIGASDEARAAKAQTDVKLIAGAVRGYRSKHGHLPETLEELATKNEKGFSQLEELPDDPWDTPYELVEGETPFEWEVVSCGPDRSLDTEDDISNKSKKEQ